MSRIPAPIDQLMWTLAEGADPQAVEEFGRRYPDYRYELAARMQLDREMRGARPQTERPNFEVQRLTPVRADANRLVWAMAGALMASLAIATVAVVSRGSVPEARATQPLGIRVEQPEIRPERTGTPIDEPGDPDRVQPESPSPPRPAAPKSGFDTLVTLRLENTMLSEAIRAVAMQANLKLTLAPGFSEERVDVQYQGVTAKAALEDLGQNFGFSVVVQQDNEAIVIPAIDASRPPALLPEGSYSQPVDEHAAPVGTSN